MRTSDPFVPNEVRYQAAPITECGTHLTAGMPTRQCLIFKKSLNRRETQQPEQRIAGCSTFLAAVDLKRFAIFGYLTCHRLAEIGRARRGECKLSQ